MLPCALFFAGCPHNFASSIATVFGVGKYVVPEKTGGWETLLRRYRCETALPCEGASQSVFGEPIVPLLFQYQKAEKE